MDLDEKITQYLINNNITGYHFGHDKNINNIVLENHTGNKSDTFISYWNEEKIGVAQPTQEQLDAL